MPVFWLGLVGLLVFYGKLGWVGGPGRLDTSYEFMFDLDVPRVTGSILIDCALAGAWDMFCNALSHIVLPAAHARLLLARLYQPHDPQLHAGAARPGIHHHRAGEGRAASGASSGGMRSRNIAVPLITVIALSYAYLLEGSVLTETVFAWPGLGLYITNALFSADMKAVMGGTIVVGFVFIAASTCSPTCSTAVVDPRAR